MSQKSWTCIEQKQGEGGGHHHGTVKQWLQRLEIFLWILKPLATKHVMQVPCFDTPINRLVEFALLITAFCMKGCLLGNNEKFNSAAI